MNELKELRNLENILGNPPRSRLQINKLFEADCEILKLEKDRYLVTSIDSLGEEVTQGLYKDVETWAWMSVMSSVSDLAASGAKALGITLSTQWRFETPLKIQKKFFSCAAQACRVAKVPLLGGDSGSAQDHVFTSSILGESVKKPLNRLGVKAGDYIVLVHNKRLGAGPALGFRCLLEQPENTFPESHFRPLPSWQMTHQLRPWIRASIDTSDGLGPCLYILSVLNDLGFTLNWQTKIHHKEALDFCRTQKIPEPMLWLGDHGDFQTLWIVPEQYIQRFESKKNACIIGKFHKNKDHLLKYDRHTLSLPLKDIANCERDLKSYKELFKSNFRFLSKHK